MHLESQKANKELVIPLTEGASPFIFFVKGIAPIIKATLLFDNFFNSLQYNIPLK